MTASGSVRDGPHAGDWRRSRPAADRFAPVWFLAAQVATLALVAAVAWLVHREPDSSDAIAMPGSGPVLSVDDVLDANGDFPPGASTVIGRLEAVVSDRGGDPVALVLARDDGTGELLILPQQRADISAAIIEAGAPLRVRAAGRLRIATPTDPPLEGGDGRLRSEFLGEPVMDADLIAIADPARPGGP